MNHKNEGMDGFCKYKVEGEVTVHFGKSDAQGRGTVGVRWKNKKRMTVGIAVSDQLFYCVRKFAHGKQFHDEFSFYFVFTKTVISLILTIHTKFT